MTAVLCGCVDDPTEPLDAGLVITATASANRGSPSAPIEVRAVMRNMSAVPRYIRADCQGRQGIFPYVRDAQGDLLGSWYSWSGCGHSEWLLEPGHTVEMTKTFDGTLYDDHNTPYELQTGRYSITFTVAVPGKVQPARLEFDWDYEASANTALHAPGAGAGR